MQERRAHSGGAGARTYARTSPTRVNRHGDAYYTYNGGDPDAVADTEKELHRLGVYETDPTRDRSAAPGRKNRIVVQIHGHDYALGQSSQPELQAAAE